MKEEQYLSEDQDINYFPMLESWDYKLDNMQDEINLNFDYDYFNLGY